MSTPADDGAPAAGCSGESSLAARATAHAVRRFALPDRWVQAWVANDEQAVMADLRHWSNGRAECRQMVPKRLREYLLGRQCARQVLEALGAAGRPIGSRSDRSPDWPPGIVGSITHTRLLVAVVAARGGGGVGIDAEELLDDASLATVLRNCLTPAEQQGLAALSAPDQRAHATLLFSAKEALFKCLYPAVRVFFDFVDAELVALDRPAVAGQAGVLRLRLLRHLASGYGAGYELSGSFRFEDGMVFTAFDR